MNAGTTAAAAPWPSVSSHLPQCRVHSPSPADPAGRPLCLYRAADGARDTYESGIVTDRPVRIRSQPGRREIHGGPDSLRPRCGPAPCYGRLSPPGSPCGNSAQASAGIASRGSARRCGLIGTGRGMLLAAGAPPSRDGCTVLFPAAQPTSNSMTRRCVSLASIIGPRTAAIRRAAGGPGTLVLAGGRATAAVRCALPRCPPGRGGIRRPATADCAAGGLGPSACTTPEAAVAITERSQSAESNARRTAPIVMVQARLRRSIGDCRPDRAVM